MEHLAAGDAGAAGKPQRVPWAPPLALKDVATKRHYIEAPSYMRRALRRSFFAPALLGRCPAAPLFRAATHEVCYPSLARRPRSSRAEPRPAAGGGIDSTLSSCHDMESLAAFLGGLLPGAAGAPAPSRQLTPRVALLALERAAQLRGGVVAPWDPSAPVSVAACEAPSDGAYAAGVRGAVLAAAQKAHFRPRLDEYEALLSALRGVGDDDTELHATLARAFLWQEAFFFARGRARRRRRRRRR